VHSAGARNSVTQEEATSDLGEAHVVKAKNRRRTRRTRKGCPGRSSKFIRDISQDSAVTHRRPTPFIPSEVASPQSLGPLKGAAEV